MTTAESPRKLTRKEQKAATRQAIKEAALRCYAERGYDGTNIADIAKTAGVAQGTFYVHFPNKEAIVQEVHDEANAALIARLLPLWAGASAGNARELLTRTADTVLDFWSGHREDLELYGEKILPSLGFQRLRDGTYPPMQRFVADRILAYGVGPGVEPADVELVVHGLLALWIRIGLQHVFGDGVPRERAVRILVDLTLDVLRSILKVDL